VKWLLSRRFPAEYGRRDNVETVNPEDKAADQAALRELLMDRLSKFLPEEQEVLTPEQAQNTPEKTTETAVLTPEMVPDTASEAPPEASPDAGA
jgi:hypothetical protein